MTIACNIDFNLLPYPPATDNCDPSPQVELVNLSILDDNICDDNLMIVQREFKAIDQYGNKSAVCAQTIKVGRLLSIDFPDNTDWDCSLYNQFPNIIEGTPLTGDYAAGSKYPRQYRQLLLHV